MNTSEFNKVVDYRIEQIKATLQKKAEEYADSDTDDRLHNFNRGAQISGESREKVLKGFMLKHLVSVFDIIDKLDKGDLPKHSTIDEKLGDVINYTILLEACLKDRLSNDLPY